MCPTNIISYSSLYFLRIDYDYDQIDSNQFEICVDCYEMMNGLIIKTNGNENKELNPTSPDVLTMQPLFTRLTTPSSPVITTRKTTIENQPDFNNKKSFLSRNSLKLDLKPVYPNTQIKNQ